MLTEAKSLKTLCDLGPTISLTELIRRFRDLAHLHRDRCVTGWDIPTEAARADTFDQCACALEAWRAGQPKWSSVHDVRQSASAMGHHTADTGE